MLVSDFHISGLNNPAFVLNGRITGVSNLTLTEGKIYMFFTIRILINRLLLRQFLLQFAVNSCCILFALSLIFCIRTMVVGLLLIKFPSN